MGWLVVCLYKYRAWLQSGLTLFVGESPSSRFPPPREEEEAQDLFKSSLLPRDPIIVSALLLDLRFSESSDFCPNQAHNMFIIQITLHDFASVTQLHSQDTALSLLPRKRRPLAKTER